jgi:hypothetical protein
MDVRVPVDQLTEGVNRRNHTGHGVGMVDNRAVNVTYGLPGEAGQPAQETAIEAEEDAQALGDGEHELAMGDGFADVTRDVLGHDEGPLLVAAGAQASAAAREGDKDFVTAAGAADAGEALVQVAAGKEPADGGGDDGSPESAALLIAVVVDALELLKVPIEQLPQR